MSDGSEVSPVYISLFSFEELRLIPILSAGKVERQHGYETQPPTDQNL